MSTATSSSDRHAQARAALAYYETADPRTISHGGTGGETYSVLDAAASMAAALRALIEPAATALTPEQIAGPIQSAVYRDWLTNEADPRSPDRMVDEAAIAGVRAGIQAAWESWESPGMGDERPPILITWQQAREWAGFDVDLDRLQECIPNSSIPEAIGVIASQFGSAEE